MQSVQHMFTESFEQSTVLTAVNLKSYSSIKINRTTHSCDHRLKKKKMNNRTRGVL